jgi:hypothetical protein
LLIKNIYYRKKRDCFKKQKGEQSPPLGLFELFYILPILSIEEIYRNEENG